MSKPCLRFRALRFLAASALALSGHAQAFVVDGDLSDWGLHRAGMASDWTPSAAIRYFTVEDQTGSGNYYLSPGWGGQAYDAEALYLSWDSSHLYLALVTGLNPATPTDPARNSYGPGDFALDFGKDGSFEFGIETTGANAGKVYSVGQWDYGLWDAGGGYINSTHKAADPLHPTSIRTGTQVGSGKLVYTGVGVNNMGLKPTDLHYFIEAAIPLSSFLGYLDRELDVHWTMNCANDSIKVDPLIGSVPEPGSLALLSLGLTGLLALRRLLSA
ncbi:MAG: PEP-CTERM sorting domain-containing protein [Pseudomonadota bacterium]